MFEAFCKDTQGNCLCLCDGLLLCRAIGHGPRNLKDISNPATVDFFLSLYGEDCVCTHGFPSYVCAKPSVPVVIWPRRASASSMSAVPVRLRA